MLGLALSVLGAGLGAFGGMSSARADAKRMQEDVRQQRQQMESAAAGARSLANRQGTAEQRAYSWATAMLTKHKYNAGASEMVMNSVNQQLAASSDRRNQYEGMALQMLASRPSEISDAYVKQAGRTGLLSGLLGGAGIGLSAAEIYKGYMKESNLAKYYKSLLPKEKKG